MYFIIYFTSISCLGGLHLSKKSKIFFPNLHSLTINALFPISFQIFIFHLGLGGGGGDIPNGQTGVVNYLKKKKKKKNWAEIRMRVVVKASLVKGPSKQRTNTVFRYQQDRKRSQIIVVYVSPFFYFKQKSPPPPPTHPLPVCL